jgi:Ser/Thr protein kinase RdoA (MazF antagonist)
MATVFRSSEKQRERDLLAAQLRRAHAQDPRLGRALGRLHRALERRRVLAEGEREARQLALMDRCWWRREERAAVLREMSRENFRARHGVGHGETQTH